MTIGSENLGNSSGKPERFGGKYRGARRDTVLTEVVSTEGDSDGRDVGPPSLELAEPPVASLSHPPREAGLSADYPSATWVAGRADSLVDHPLLRGLLLELPPKGSVPPPQWLDRWFEATRAILELLYVQGQVGPR